MKNALRALILLAFGSGLFFLYQNATTLPTDPLAGTTLYVSDPEIVDALDWNVDKKQAGDSKFFVFQGAQSFMGYSANGSTSLYTGNSVEDLKFNFTGVMKKGADEADIDFCGAWLQDVRQINGVLRGLYHAERACNYSNNGQSYATIGYASSTDGGRTFVRDSDSQKALALKSELDPIDGKFTGNGNQSVIQWKGFLYNYYTELDPDPGWVTGLARSPLVSSGPGNGEPGSWKKFFRVGDQESANFASSAIGGPISPIQNVFRSASMGVMLPVAKPPVVLALWPTSEGILLRSSSDAIQFPLIDRKLEVFDELDWRRTQVFKIGDASFNAYTKVFVLDKQKQFGEIHKTDQISVCRGATQVIRSNPMNGITKLCLSTEKEVATFFLWQSQTSLTGLNEQPMHVDNSIPIYVCFDSGTSNSILGTDPSCGSQNVAAGKSQILGYAPKRPAGDLAAYTSLVAPQGNNQFQDRFYLFYSFVQHGDLVEKRTILRRNVLVRPQQVNRPKVLISLNEYLSAKGTRAAAATFPGNEFLKTKFLGWISTQKEGMYDRLLIRCLNQASGEQYLRTGSTSCQRGETLVRTEGYIASLKDPGRGDQKPLYRCQISNSMKVVHGNTENCDASDVTDRAMLGFVEGDSPRQELVRYYKQSNSDFWTTTVLPHRSYLEKTPLSLGYLSLVPNEQDQVAVFECKRTASNKFVLRTSYEGGCVSGEVKTRVIGYLAAQGFPGARPLVRCYALNQDAFLTANSLDCGNPAVSYSQVKTLGFLRAEPL